MIKPTHVIERLNQPLCEADLHALASLLSEIVNVGEAVSFLSPLSVERAADWWRESLSIAADRAIHLVARCDGRIVGTVQLHPSWAPNQPHRAEVMKLLVAASHRHAGLGAQLMQSLEKVAREADFHLLTLDAKCGAAAERLYRRMGWIYVGTIPEFAFDPDGRTPHDAVIYYKSL